MRYQKKSGKEWILNFSFSQQDSRLDEEEVKLLEELVTQWEQKKKQKIQFIEQFLQS
jgi:hypothetical protein